jgi:DNA topoisomerase-1
MKDFLYNEKEKVKELKEIKKSKDKSETSTIIDPDEKYKTATVDGKIQNISIYKVEPPALFIGRGKNPYLGKIKKRINPEDVTINIGKDAEIPKSPSGHKWGKIIHDRKVEWLASWKDSITGKSKYLWLSQQSDIKSGNDQKKYDLARKLKKKIHKINEDNEINMRSHDDKIMQIATALYFIDKLAIRVGNEKSEDTADTVGVTSLRVEHLVLTDPDKITLDFLGKDSVQYVNTVEVLPLVYTNVKKLLKNKEKGDQVFDRITSNDVNKYLQEFMKDLTAKVFRTYNASNIFQKELVKISKKYEGIENVEKQIMEDFAKANAKVAKLLNHQKNVSTGYKKNIDKINSQVEVLKKKLNATRRKTKKNPSTIQKLKDKIKNYKSKKDLVKEMKNISLGTSKANYLDPRITVAFLKQHNLDVNKIFPKTLQNKFAWAFVIGDDYRF